jgi:hypothetical protein
MNVEISRNLPSSRIALWAASGWAFCTLAIVLISDRRPFAIDEFDSNATKLGAIGFTAVFIAPLLLPVASFRLRNINRRRSVWLGCALFSLLLAGLTVFSVGWLFLFVSGLLSWAWWISRRRRPVERTWISPLLTCWIVLAFGGALWLLFLRDTPMCWNGSSWTSSSSAGHADCTSDIIDSLESALALGSIALGFAGVAAILRMWPQND